MFDTSRLLLSVGVALLTTTSAPAGVLYHVVLMAGQSNMDGHWQTTKGTADGAATSLLPTALQNPQAGVLYYNHPVETTNSFDTGTTLSALQPGQYFGPEITFGQKMTADRPTNKYLLIKYAIAGTDLSYQWQSAPSASDPNQGYIYKNFKKAVTAALGQVTAAGDTYQIDGMLWLQGEADAADPTKAAAYQTNLSNLITKVRASYGANLPFIIGGIGYTSDASGQVDRNLVRSAFGNVAATMTDVRYFDNDDLNAAKSLHFSASAMQTIGQRYAAILSSVPEPATASMIGVGGTALLLRRRRAAH